MDQKLVQREFAPHIALFNNASLQSSINWLLANGFDYGTIIATILAHLPEVIAALKSPNPGLAILQILIDMLPKPNFSSVPSAKIGK